ncbi:uncharacterized protein LOC129732504 [Wyeomyia smithii]|uniref:uncharacterized protein LOC129732504 n=1 Tax=Wyeomyia smithii TaxID=174621 RepID=UPI002467DDDD|nr:uncharacterized protein LOC129732504 [Wyeomyia smithii]
MADESLRNALSINSSQIETMTHFMEEHSDLARNSLKAPDARKHFNKLWNKLKDSLNEQGPPIREIPEWKKVWADYKYKVKSKLRQNMINIKKTGGGPNKHKHLNSFEESVVRSAGLNASVNGIAKTKSYGCRKLLQADNHYDGEANVSEHNSQTTPITEEGEMIIEEFIDIENLEDDPENGITGTTGSIMKKRTNAKREKLELLKRYVKAKEENNEMQKALLRVKEESLAIKRSMWEIKLKKMKLKYGNDAAEE